MKNLNRRQALQIGLGLASSAATAASVFAQNLPDSARILVGFPPGGAPDLISRRLAEQLTGKLARAVIVDNRAGAGGRIAADVARQAAPDGLTLLLNPAGMLTINPHIYTKLNYDPFKDFAPISLAANIDFGFAVGPAVPATVKTLGDFVAWAQSNKGKVSFGSPAAGSPPHFVGDALSRTFGLEMIHAPYRGATPALNDLFGGQIAGLVLTLGDLIGHAKAGKLRLLASSGLVRSKFAPAVPTFNELGVAGLNQRDWFGIYIAGAPSAQTQAKIGQLVRNAVASAAYIDALAAGSIEAAVSSATELDALAKRDFALWRPVVKASGFTAEN